MFEVTFPNGRKIVPALIVVDMQICRMALLAKVVHMIG